MKTINMLLAAAAALTIGGLATADTASAGSRHKDHIYADSFGNLIVYSRSGYKRIVIGAGHLAEELSAYESGGAEPEVEYLDEPRHQRHHARRGCSDGAVLLKGRSYMYGLPDGYVPTPACDDIR